MRDFAKIVLVRLEVSHTSLINRKVHHYHTTSVRYFRVAYHPGCTVIYRYGSSLAPAFCKSKGKFGQYLQRMLLAFSAGEGYTLSSEDS